MAAAPEPVVTEVAPDIYRISGFVNGDDKARDSSACGGRDRDDDRP
jgi:hypothetical protein